MSDQNMTARIELSVEDRASAVVRAFRGEIDKTTKSLKALTNTKMPEALKAKLDGTGARETVDSFKQATEAARKLGAIQAQDSRRRRADTRAEASERRVFDAADVAALKAKFAFQTRMGQQRAQEQATADRQRRAAEAGDMRAMRDRVRMIGRVSRERIAAIRGAERAQEQADARAERAEATASRRRAANERQHRAERDRTRREMIGRGRESFTRGRDAVREISRPPAALAAAGTAGAVAGARRVLKSEGDVDAAEINAQIYAGLSKDAARKLRDKWAAPLAESLGSQTDKLLNAYVDAVKVGIPAAGAQEFAALSTKTSEAWGVPFETVTDTLGTVNSILTSKGAAYDGKRLRSVANTLQHLAAKQSTTPEKLISFLQRGAGGADVLGMSMESALAFGSASTSLGNQAGQSGSLLDFIAGRVVEMPKLTKQRGQEGKEARRLLDALGYGSADDMEARRRQDPDSFLPDLMERFSKIQDPKEQDQAIRFFAGREWLGEFGRMVKGADTYREASKLAKEAKGLDAIAAVWDLHKLKLAFVFKQFGAGFTNILGEFGKVLSLMARQAGDYWLEWTAKLRAGGLQARFRAALDGLIEGFGFRDLPDMLKGILGTPGEGDAGAISTWKATAREFAAGIRDVVGSIKAVVSAFTGGSPETIARWTGRILALSAALVLLSPVLGVLGGMISGIVALASAAASVAAAAKLAGAVGATGAAGGAAGAVGSGFWTVAGGLIAVGFLAAVAKHLNVLNPLDTSKGLGRGILEFLDPGLASRVYGDRQPETGQGSTWNDPPARVQRQSAGQDWRGLVSPASFSPLEDLSDSVDRLDRTMNGQAARIRLASLNGSTISALDRASGIGGLVGGGTGYSNGVGFGPSGFPETAGMSGHGGSGGSGGGVTDPRMSGDVADRAKAAHDFFRSKGLSEEATAGILASIKQESNFTPNARGDGGKAHGLFQHHADRRAQIQAATGINMSTASFQQQLEGAWWEMNHGDAGAQRALKILRTPGISAREAGGAFVQNFERPARDERGERGALAEGMLKQFGGSGSQAGAVSGGVGAGGAVDVASKYLGMNELRDNAALKGFVGREIIGAQNAWCAGFVNSSLKAVGMKGTGSAVANSFLGWGSQVDPSKAQKGDVLVEHRGKGLNATGGHVGFATGNKRVGRDGQLELEMLSGNNNDGVGTSWEKASKVAVRRSTEAAAAAAAATVAGTGFTSTGWKRAVSPSEAASQVPARPTPEDLAGQAAQPRPVQVVPGGGGQGGVGGSGNGTVVHAPVTIHAGAQSPAEIAGSLQRHVAEARGFRTHDFEPELT